MFKTREELIVIQAEATTPIPTGVVFWSHDKGTAKLIIQLKKDHINQTLPQGTTVPILLEFNSDTAAKGKGRHIYHAVIENALEGIVSIVLEDNILGYVGRVDGSVYIELPDSRSLDTAGRFTFDIKRSPIDDDVPELEDYYWQGFGEIMEQYHESIAEIKSEAKALLDSLTADVTTVQNELTNLNTRIDEINQKIDDNDVFTKAETSANVVDQIVGKESNTRNIITDMKNKIATSVTENPNLAFTNYTVTELLIPGDGRETPQISYDELSSVDTRIFTLTRNEANVPSQVLASWNILEIAKKNIGEKFFFDNGATDKPSQINLLRNRLTTLSGSCVGYGSGPKGNRLTISAWQRTIKTWQYRTPHTSGSDKLITSSILPTSIFAYIDDEGFFHTLIYADACNGSTPSIIKVNYVSVEFTMNISAHDHIESMIAANHVENLATQEEAETGENNSKTMTPLRVSQAISKWVANKFISLAGNDTISGTKDFVGNLLVNKKRVLTVDDLPSDSVNLSVVNGNSGNARLYWQGKSVTIYFTVLNGKSGGGNDSTILTIPEGYRPPTGFEKLIGSVDRSALNSAQISIGADGVVRWRRNSNYASDYTFEVTFVRA
ncbi:BppU family phage baseplate upper protein [Enterococcus raffinosus]|uniref:BppU family phage baseplate upper protein n=1 Tax=Enterococcus raffinosus TaxID=71452 RepID=UPI00288FFAA4|nr:BppU family phage baseplate upper protein [Enterococcus raffinosus]MDT2570249.1 BppU family phage baseplate upper protein [Enterococcus raffinosus]